MLRLEVLLLVLLLLLSHFILLVLLICLERLHLTPHSHYLLPSFFAFTSLSAVYTLTNMARMNVCNVFTPGCANFVNVSCAHIFTDTQTTLPLSLLFPTHLTLLNFVFCLTFLLRSGLQIRRLCAISVNLFRPISIFRSFCSAAATERQRGGSGEISKCLPAVRYANVYLEIRLTLRRMRNVSV